MAEPINRNGVLYEPQAGGGYKIVGYADAPAGGPQVVVPGKTPAKPEPKFIPGAPKPMILGDNGNAVPVTGIPDTPPEPPKASPLPAGWMIGPDGKAMRIPGLPTGATSDVKQLDPAIRAKALADYQTAHQLDGIISDIGRKFKAGPGATSGFLGVRDYLPLTVNQEFDNAGNAARGIVGTALGFTGGQLNTPREAEQAVGPYVPNANDRDSVIKDKIAKLEDLRDTARARAIATLGGVPDQNGQVTPETLDRGPGIDQTVRPTDPSLQASTNGYSESIDPYRKQIGARVSVMLANPAVSDAKIQEFLQHAGIDPSQTSIGDALRNRRSPKYQSYLKANPYPLDPSFYTDKKPLTGAAATLNSAASSKGGAYTAAAADSILAGHLHNVAGALGGNPDQVNAGIAAVRAEHPYAATVGDMSGQAIDQAMFNFLPGISKLGKAKELASDALYGGASGDGTVGGTLSSAGTNAIGGVAGRRLGEGLKVLAKGVNPSSSLAYLNQAGVPLTVGQIARGTNSVVGRGVGGIEDRVAGLPVFDGIINSARQRGERGFNSAAFKEAGLSGATGAAGITEGRHAVDGAYGFLDHTQLPLDAQFAGSQAAVRASVPGMPAHGQGVIANLDSIDQLSSGGALPGRDWRDAIAAARDDGSSLTGQSYPRQARAAFGDIDNNLQGLASRQGPPGTLDNLQKANALFRQFKTLSGALDNGPAQARDELFSPSRLDTASRAGARKFGGQVSSIEGNRPFYDLSKAGMDVMPNQVPDSGTAGRSLLYGAGLTALGGGLGAGAGAVSGGDSESAKAGGEFGGVGTLASLGALAALYSKHGQAGVQKLLLGERGPAAQAVFNYIDNSKVLSKALSKKTLGLFGGALSRDVMRDPYSTGE